MTGKSSVGSESMAVCPRRKGGEEISKSKSKSSSKKRRKMRGEWS